MERRFWIVLAAAGVFAPAVLLLDGPGFLRQSALGLATAGFLFLIARTSSIDPRQVLACIAVATLGEIVLSLGWGLYHYQFAVIPLYVPPGHGVFYTLAVLTAQQEALRRYETQITRSVLLFGTVVAALSLWVFGDVWGVLWWVGAFALIRRSRHRLMLSTCVVLTMLLEWTGTAIGNWRWLAEVPFLGLRSANPPAGVGILYVVLDVIVVWISTLPRRRIAVEATQT